ncbi:hypothetical protein M378DRAFT_689750 [Amanita muscaria Koide BX008]|uniref:Uncharacterized protein n=1 Tax=Amanita muscaria (strain Koide BX008) TaxID=946122 RepID=A0A0C2TQS3_AMAMK|nr:hypothetical protein M378DRAFT_689750 [Amanita muscaria Koide BX008]
MVQDLIGIDMPEKDCVVAANANLKLDLKKDKRSHFSHVLVNHGRIPAIEGFHYGSQIRNGWTCLKEEASFQSVTRRYPLIRSQVR